MFKPFRTTHPAIKILSSALIDLPAPNNISVWWNYGSLLGLCLVIQIATGLFLSMHYSPNIEMAFASVGHITRDVNYGWLLRSTHANGASMFFLFLYLHAGRGLYYGSFKHRETWYIGVILFILTMATAFTGYVLPWGQMSFWGATVITNLFSAIPYIGKSLVEWIWGGFAVDNPTLNRFFSFHFILPFIIIGVTILHIMFLHLTGSNNPIGLSADSERIPFHQYYSMKDVLGYAIALTTLSCLVLFEPNLFADPENYLVSNPLVTPVHIKPEWYFLWMYAILRSIPNKLGGVLAMFAAILMMFIFPLATTNNKSSLSFYPVSKYLFWILIISLGVLTWVGGQPVENPFIEVGQTFTFLYFAYFILSPLYMRMWDNLCKR